MSDEPPSDHRDATLLPASPLCRDVLDLAVSNERAPIANHSIRSYLFARLLARHRRATAEVDDELLFAACVLHDLGLSELGNRHNRFEIDGADLAAEFLTDRRLPTESVDAVWDAIALHSSAGLAERRSALCAITQAGVWADFGAAADFVTDAQAIAIHQAFPRTGFPAALADVIVGQAQEQPQKAPRYSLADAMLQERAGPDGLTRMEHDAPKSRWAALATSGASAG